MAILTTKNAKRSDAGPYRVTLKNRYGGDSVKLNVNVLDKPGAPQGPLEPTNVEAEAMTLNWRPPKDNGGDDITNYVVEKKDPKSGEWKRVRIYEQCCIGRIVLSLGVSDWDANGHKLQGAKSGRGPGI